MYIYIYIYTYTYINKQTYLDSYDLTQSALIRSRSRNGKGGEQ